METRNNIKPYRTAQPGEILSEELQARGIKQKDFALSIGMTPGNFNAIIKGKRNITQNIADKIAEQLEGITASFWVRVQNAYNESIKQPPAVEPQRVEKQQDNEIAILKHFAIIENEIAQLRRLLIAR